LSAPSPMSELGTGGEMASGALRGNLPVNNFRDGLFPDAQKISGMAMRDTGIKAGMEGCFACPVRCKKIIKFEEPYKCEPVYGGPEYETLASIGSNCGISDLKADCKGNEPCNAYSLDTISTGSVIAFAMECYEKGLLTKKDTDGLELKFGNADAMLKAIDLIAYRKGIGALMAEGTARMVEKIGKACEPFAMHVKGREPGMHDPRANTPLGIGYVVNSNGADHCLALSGGAGSGPMGFEQLHAFGLLEYLPNDLSAYRVSFYRLFQCLGVTKDCLVMCDFVPVNYEREIEILKAVTGWDTGIIELLRIGERVMNLMRLINLREGFTAADDILPERYYQPKTDGVLSEKGKGVDKEKMDKARQYYYTYMGWDSRGVPLPEKLAELGLESV